MNNPQQLQKLILRQTLKLHAPLTLTPTPTPTPTPTSTKPLTELSLQYTPTNKQDITELHTLITQHLGYSSKQKAEIHQRANRLGELDIEEKYTHFYDLEQKGDGYLVEVGVALGRRTQDQTGEVGTCQCCGLVEQMHVLPRNIQIEHLNNIGLSTFLLFLTVKNLSKMLLILFFIFTIYALITNKTISTSYQQSLESTLQSTLQSTLPPTQPIPQPEQTYIGPFLPFSTGSKIFYLHIESIRAFQVQAWLVLAVVVLWGLYFGVVKREEKMAEYVVDLESQTASDFTVLFHNIPKWMGKEVLEAQLEEYRHSLLCTYKKQHISNPIKINKINQIIPFYVTKQDLQDDQLEHLIKQYQQNQQKLLNLLKQRQHSPTFITPPTERQALYAQRTWLVKQREVRENQLMHRVREEKIRENDLGGRDTMAAFVTFETIHNKEFVECANGRGWGRVVYNWLFCKNRRYFKYRDADGGKGLFRAQITPAPEPEDVIWTNAGQTFCSAFRRKLLTFSATTILLCLSLFITYYLTTLQIAEQTQSKTSQSLLPQLLSTAIPLTLTLFNQIIQSTHPILTIVAILRMTKYERNFTRIIDQTSLGVKGVLALLINSIVIPVAVNLSVKENVFGVDGLADVVFWLAVGNAGVAPVMRFVNPGFIIQYIKRKYLLYRPWSRLAKPQQTLNTDSQPPQFPIGYQYIHLTNLYLFTCFFASLQPLVVPIGLLGLLLYYYAEKFYLLYYSKRPIPGDDTINDAMYQLIYVGPGFLGGGLLFVGFVGNGVFFEDVREQLGVIFGITILILLIPYEKLIQLRCITQKLDEQDISYSQVRDQLPSEYDRLNPNSAREAIVEYQEYLRGRVGRNGKGGNGEMVETCGGEMEEFGLRKGVRKSRTVTGGGIKRIENYEHLDVSIKQHSIPSTYGSSNANPWQKNSRNY